MVDTKSINDLHRHAARRHLARPTLGNCPCLQSSPPPDAFLASAKATVKCITFFFN
jgi:hypothetical protein